MLILHNFTKLGLKAKKYSNYKFLHKKIIKNHMQKKKTESHV